MIQINNNPFCVLGITINAGEREIQKQLTKAKRFSEVGKPLIFDTDYPFIGKIDRNSTSISKASNDISQTIDRLFYSLFWYWDNNHIDKLAFDNLKKDNLDKSLEIWTKVVKDGDVSIKNYSCLANLKSLYMGLSFKENSVDFEYLKKGSQMMGLFINHNGLNSYIKEVAGDHFKLDSNELEIKVINSIYEKVKSFIGKSNGVSREEFLSYFTTFSKSSVQHIYNKFTGDPIKKVEDQINTTSDLREQNPIEALSFGETLYKNTKSQIASLLKMLGQEDLKYQMLANKLANEILQCGIDYFNKLRDENKAEDEDGNKVLKLCKLAKKLVASFESQTNARIDENQKIISNWVNDSSKKLIAAFNNAMEVFESFDNWKGSNVMGPPGAWNWGRPNLIGAGNVLVKIMQESYASYLGEELDSSDSSSDEFLSFSDQTAQLLIAMAVKHGNNIIKSEDDCIGLLRKVNNIYMEKDTRSNLFKNLGIIEENKRINASNELNRLISSNNSSRGGCYIATMVYKDYDHPQVMVLRNFRDNHLAEFFFGRAFIKFYYKYSPSWVLFLENKKTLNNIIRGALNQLIRLIKFI